jgi:hypothetical protein
MEVINKKYHLKQLGLNLYILDSLIRGKINNLYIDCELQSKSNKDI